MSTDAAALAADASPLAIRPYAGAEADHDHIVRIQNAAWRAPCSR